VIRLARSTEPRAAQQPPTRHPVNRYRFSLRLIIGTVPAVALVAAVSFGSAVWPSAKAQPVGATTASTGHRLSARESLRGSFGWLASTTPPATWDRLEVPAGLGTLSSPPGFRAVEGDPGTLTLALRNAVGTYLGYLNVTPQQGDETLQDWDAFRLSHLLDDDAVTDHEDASVTDLRWATGARSCVIDDYVTTSGHHHFHEVACYVMSHSVGSVVVATTPSGDPAHVWTELESAVAAYPFE
jgi:hypothetical protein